MLIPPSTAWRSISASSSAAKSRRSRAATFCSSWATLLAPISAEVTRGSRSVQAIASWASVCPRPCAISFSARTRARVSSVEQVGRQRLGAARARAVRDRRQVAVGQHALGERREGDAADAALLEDVEQPVLDPAVEHRVGRLVDQQRRAERRRRIAAASRVCCGEYDEMPTYSALPWRTAVSSAPIVSSSGVSGSKRCE